MRKPLFYVLVTDVDEIHDMPGTWSDDDYLELLTRLEVDDLDGISGSDLLEMAMMALQDMEPDDAADAVLAHKLGNALTPGARQNIVQDLLEGQKPWEEAADIMLHSRIFAAAVLLNKCFPSGFPRPEMMRLSLEITALAPEAKPLLSKPPQAAFVTRLLADAMDAHSILERLFDRQLASRSFPEAEGIIWLAELQASSSGSDSTRSLAVYSSVHWLDEMEKISEFESSAYEDETREAGES